MGCAWRTRGGPSRFAMALAALPLFALGPPARARAGSPQGLAFEEYATRAAFILSLAKFTEWPEGALPAGEPLAWRAGGKSPGPGPGIWPACPGWGGRSWSGGSAASRTSACQILYFPSAEEESLPPMQAKLAAQGVLTIGETSFFLGYGGALQLFKEDGRLRFILNRRVLDQSHLRMAAQVQRLAKQVIDRPAQ